MFYSRRENRPTSCNAELWLANSLFTRQTCDIWSTQLIYAVTLRNRLTSDQLTLNKCTTSKTPLAWTCDTNGPPAHTSTGVALGGSGVQERSRSSTCKLEKHSQQGFVKDRNHLRGSRGGSSKQIRMASKCGPMHPFGCRLNQGQGQGHDRQSTHYSPV